MLFHACSLRSSIYKTLSRQKMSNFLNNKTSVPCVCWTSRWLISHFLSKIRRFTTPSFTNKYKSLSLGYFQWVAQPCISRSISEDDSVVSVYTKNPAAGEGPKTSGVYLIASSIADRITSPISKFFGFGNIENTTTTKRPFHRIELMDDVPDMVTKADVNPLNNEIPRERDVEELSPGGKINKSVKRPEKITHYLPSNENIELNETINEIGSGSEEPFGFDDSIDDDFDDTEHRPREGGLIYVLEVIGSVIQLLWGGFLALISPPKSS